MHKHKSLRLLLALVFLLLAACDANTPATPSPTSPTQVPATATALSTVPPAPTDTAVVVAPTATLERPTATANPTDTPQPPQPTSTPANKEAEASPTPLSSTPAAQVSTQGCPAALMPQVPQDSIGDDLYPNLGNAGYDVQHYDINLGVDVAKNTISGTTTINLRPLQDLTAFNFDFHGLNISSLTVDGAAATH